MSYTVTLTKKAGSAEANIFLGNRAGAGAALSDWQTLQRYDEIRHLNIIFVIIESTDQRLFQPTLNIRYGEDYAGSSTYPSRAPLKAGNVKQWILEFIKNTQEKQAQVQNEPEIEETKPIEAQVVTKKSFFRNAVPTSTPVTETARSTAQAPSDPVITETPSWVKPAVIAGTIVGAALAGIGVALAAQPDRDDDAPLLFLGDDDKPVNWDNK